MSLTKIPTPYNYVYKSELTIPFLIRQTKWYHRKATRQAALAALEEVRTLRKRLSIAAVEISEWRAKVGEAAYSLPGPQFAKLAEDGIRNRIGTWLTITDEDFTTDEDPTT